MTSVQATILAMAIGIVIQIILGVYFYGRLTERVAAHGEAITNLRASDKSQWRRIDNHGRQLVAIKTKVGMHVDDNEDDYKDET